MEIRTFEFVRFTIRSSFLDLLEHNLDVASPFIKGCETGQSKIINICLTALQRLITSQMLTEVYPNHTYSNISLAFRGIFIESCKHNGRFRVRRTQVAANDYFTCHC